MRYLLTCPQVHLSATMLFSAASRGFPAIDGFLVFRRVRVWVRVRVRSLELGRHGGPATTGMNLWTTEPSDYEWANIINDHLTME